MISIEMKLLSLTSIALSLAENGPKIRNANIRSCKQCIHFQPDPSIYSGSTSTFAKCKMFGEKDIITDKITFDYADRCRTQEDKCGKEGKYFEPEPNLSLKVFVHNLRSNSGLFLLWSVMFTTIGATVYPLIHK